MDNVDLVCKRLAEAWKEEKKYISSMSRIEESQYYRDIILLGEPAIPFILRELRREPDYWFTALYLITGVNPVPPEDQGNLRQMTEHWLAWGRLWINLCKS